ncbi:hypothetical protein [Arthrobacter sp. Soil763]|uniref:hypothetical protein n=1 Tax=Arthrobacter sp. Soil763 TaxID=1736402 RepID=UPI000700C375|nr:hypothetical protein [Arthrobacter sp. Soil763]KRE77402.1 hypothetical protein ASG71_13925 [Arthrobacter sp. Soil763]
MSVPIILAIAAVVVAAVALGTVLARQKDPQRRATVLTRTGAVLMTVFTVFAGAFIGGYAMEAPGGSAGLLMVLAWAVPMLVLAVLAWLWPAATAPLLMALTAALIAVGVWFALDPATARGLQDANGPVLAVGVVALAFPAAVLGLKRTGPAGRLLLAIGVLPLLLTVVGRSGPASSLAAASAVPLVTGVVYLLAARMARGRSTPDNVRASTA